MDLNNHYLLDKVARIKKNVIISTGFGNEKEIIDAANIFKKRKKNNVIFLHCISLYPPKNVKHINLKFINKIEKITGFKSGFSDHTIWPETLYAAASLGSVVIEKHFTFNKNAKGWDHAISADYKDMNNIVKSCKFIHGLLGNSKKNISKEENYLSKIMRRSPYVIKTINKNSILNEENLALQRPEKGIKARQFIKILGKRANRELKSDSILKKNQYF
jgi:sialic acid synthase SpsE